MSNRGGRILIPFSKEELDVLLKYEPDSGRLTWKTRPQYLFSSSRACNAWNAKFAGARAGRLSAGPTGYQKRTLSLLGKEYYEHRVIWMMMTGNQPPKEIDHINRNATDNRWANLRDGMGVNHLSRSRNSRSKSGISGIFRENRYNYWRVQVCRNRVRSKCVYFKDEDFDLAVMELLEQRIEYGFDPTHGFEAPHYTEGST